MISDFPKVQLEQWPTPLHELNRYGARCGLDHLYIKRDDLNLLGLGGNKLRKMEYWLGEAAERDCDAVLVAGGVQSNLVRLTAAACAKIGMECIAVHNDDEPGFYQGNALLNRMYGARQIWLGPVDENERGAYVRDLADSMEASGRRPYNINEEFVGTLGYYHCAQEIAAQNAERGLGIKHVVIVGAMGFTAAGFIYGNLLLDQPFQVHVISVEYPLGRLHNILKGNLEALEGLTGMAPRADFKTHTTLYDRWMGEGWGKTTGESLQAIRDLAACEGIIIDHVYNAKVFTALSGLRESGVIGAAEPTCIIHTGGAPAFFGYADLFQPAEHAGPGLIRRLRKEDLPAALGLVRETFMEFEAPDYPEAGVAEFMKFIDFESIQAKFDEGKLDFRGCFSETGEILGVIAVRGGNHIALLFVRKTHHRQGIAGRLIGTVKESCRADRMTVNSSPYALQAYRRMGFEDDSAEKTVNGIRFIPMTLTLKRAGEQ